jgi:hypothetical protein
MNWPDPAINGTGKPVDNHIAAYGDSLGSGPLIERAAGMSPLCPPSPNPQYTDSCIGPRTHSVPASQIVVNNRPSTRSHATHSITASFLDRCRIS